jgi:hypothetical protein
VNKQEELYKKVEDDLFDRLSFTHCEITGKTYHLFYTPFSEFHYFCSDFLIPDGDIPKDIVNYLKGVMGFNDDESNKLWESLRYRLIKKEREIFGFIQ